MHKWIAEWPTINVYMFELNLEMINGMCFIDDSNIFLDSCTSTGNFQLPFCWHSFHFSQSIFAFLFAAVVTVTVVNKYSNVKHTQV